MLRDERCYILKKISDVEDISLDQSEREIGPDMIIHSSDSYSYAGIKFQCHEF